MNGIMESRGDTDTLRSMMEIIKDHKDLKLFNNSRTFSQFELNKALISSCHHGYIFLVREIVRLGADKETRDRNGNTPLLICVDNGFMRTAMLLIRQKVNINAANDFDDSALILAARSTGSVEMVKRLLARKRININHQNREGNTALMKAIESINLYAIRLILNSQENPTDVLEGIKNCRSETAQDIAEKMSIFNTVKFLIKQSIEVYNPILAAVLMCDLDSFDTLMNCQFCEQSDKKGFIKDSFRVIFLKHKYSRENFNENEEKIIQRLLQYATDVNEYFYSSSPLIVAARVGSCNVLKMLLNDKAHLHSLCSTEQKNLLAVSAEYGHADIIELLLKHDQNMSEKSLTLLAVITAMKNGHMDCIEILRKYGASLDIRFAFESFVKENDSMHLKYLVENFKAGINREVSAEVIDNFLVAAAREGRINIIGLLIDAGANVNCVNGAKKTPLMEAKKCGGCQLSGAERCCSQKQQYKR